MYINILYLIHQHQYNIIHYTFIMACENKILYPDLYLNSVTLFRISY